MERRASGGGSESEILAKLAYEANLRALDKQESLLDEIRSRAGILLGASSLATSFLGQRAFQGSPAVGWSVVAIAAFVISIASSVYILLPKGSLVFSLVGTAIYEQLYEYRRDSVETYRVGAAALVLEILSFLALLSDSIF